MGAARRFVAEHVAAWKAEGVLDAAVLLTSELVTNSVLHARTEIEVEVELLAQERVQICVRDRSRFSPRRRKHASDATTGRGIELLDKLAHSWDLTVDESGKVLRFVLDAADEDPWVEVGDSLLEADL